MPQSSEQYLELGLAASTQLGPRHWRCPVLSRRSPFSLYLVLSLCFCFCLWRRDSFWIVQKEEVVDRMLPYVLLPFTMLTPSSTSNNNNNNTKLHGGNKSYFLVKLLFSSLDVLHLHCFLTHDRTERRLIVVISSPCLGERRAKQMTQHTVNLNQAGLFASIWC